MKQTGKFGYRASAIVLGLGALALLSGCNGFFTAIINNPSGGSSTFAYVANVASSGTGGTITEYSLTSGVLAALSGQTTFIKIPGGPGRRNDAVKRDAGATAPLMR